MTASRLALLVTTFICVADAWGQSNRREPHIGYIYPGGGRRGSVFQVGVGGQHLGGVTDVYVSGEGVNASIIKHYKPVRNIPREQRLELTKRFRELSDKRWAELARQGLVKGPPPWKKAARKRPGKSRKNQAKSRKNPGKSAKSPAKRGKESVAAGKSPAKRGKESIAAGKSPTKRGKESVAAGKGPAKRGKESVVAGKGPAKRGTKPVAAGKGPAKRGKASADKPGAEKAETVKLPAHPMLRDLEKKSLRELQHIRTRFLNLRKGQRNAQIGETVLIEVTIDRGAAPGDRELRLGTRQGLTNPMVFQVGHLPETRELERNDPSTYDPLPKEPPMDLPVVINGQVLPGDVDRFRFRAERGQRLLIEAHARRLVPFLADAVPGWFQATLALFDTKGNEVAFVDDFRFDPDPVLFYKVPRDGVYELEIRDSIYRGREDFVYRISVGQQPFITRMFPMGGRAGRRTFASVDGWNLRKKKRQLDTEPGADDIRRTTFDYGKRMSNRVTYAVDTLRDYPEAETNDTAADAQRIVLPRIVNGCITRPGDVDTFRFEGRADMEVVAEVMARRLHSPLDSVLRLTDAAGRVLEWNDDQVYKEGHLHTDMGLLTHHADSYLRVRLPQDGVYCVQVADARNHGGEAYGYRLRIGPPRPDFALRSTPSSLNVVAGRSVPICVHVLRRDGFDGEIKLALKDAPGGFSLSGAMIPPGRNRVRMTLNAPGRRFDKPITLELEGRAVIDGKTVSRPVGPCENVMQAYLYRHLAPSRELMVAVMKGGRSGRSGRPIEWAGKGTVRIPAGGTTQVQLKTPGFRKIRKIDLSLSDPPAGMTVEKVTVVPGGVTLKLKADEKAMQIGYADNLIVEAFTEVVRGAKGGKGKKTKRRVSVGVLPAIPFTIVQK